MLPAMNSPPLLRFIEVHDSRTPRRGSAP
jgi:hypothetical protein